MRINGSYSITITLPSSSCLKFSADSVEIEIGSYFVNIAVPEYPFFSDELCQYDLYFSLNNVSYLFAFIESISIFVSLKHIISGSSFCINLFILHF